MYKPSELHFFLNELGIAPKKGLSQNFLIDGNIIKKIVSTSSVQKGDIVLEIGPGPGSMTQFLLETGAHVIAVEKDKTLASALERLKGPEKKLDIYCDDILTFPLEERLASYTHVKVIANLPYHLTTPILVHLISKQHLFSSFTLMVQEEVAKRFVAVPNTKDYSSFTVFLNFYTKTRYAFFVSKNCFYPKPSVDSAIVVIEPKIPPFVSSVSGFFSMTRLAFEHRRKMLRGSLKPLFEPEKIIYALEKIGQNPLARPENLSLKDFLQIYEILRT